MERGRGEEGRGFKTFGECVIMLKGGRDGAKHAIWWVRDGGTLMNCEASQDLPEGE